MRVGGGYMNFVEFVKKYGKFEQVKIIKAQNNASQAASGSTPRVSTVVKSGKTWKSVNMNK